MTARLHLLLAAACVLALLQLALGQACSKASWGRKSTPTKYEMTYLSPGIRDWEVSIPPPDCRAVGGVVEVCDYDKAPQAKFMSPFVVKVHRTGNLQFSGTFDVTIFCGEGTNARSLQQDD